MAKRPLNRPLGNSELVYSTDGGGVKQTKKSQSQKQQNKKQQSQQKQQQNQPKADGIARLRRETKGRGGKTMTTIDGLRLGPAELKELGTELKRLCGTGGSVKDGIIEIQGDHRDRLAAELEKRGFKAKLAGG
jgi:translation initiation factor 1